MKKYGTIILFVLAFILISYLLYSQQQLVNQMAELKEDTDTRLNVMEGEVDSMKSEVSSWQTTLQETNNQLNARLNDLEQGTS